MKKLWISLLAVLGIMVGMTGCAPQVAAPSAAPEPVKLRVVALPILDALPIFVAQNQGLFAKNNLDVEFIPAGSAPERDQLIAAGQADAMINEVLSAMFFNKDGIRVQVHRRSGVVTVYTRSLDEITRLIDGSALSPRGRGRAIELFQRLAEADALRLRPHPYEYFLYYDV